MPVKGRVMGFFRICGEGVTGSRTASGQAAGAERGPEPADRGRGMQTVS